MKMNQEKLKKFAKILKTVFGVFYWVALVAGVTAIVGFIITLFIPADVFKTSERGTLSFTVDGVLKLTVDPQAVVNTSFKPFLQAVLSVVTAISLIFASITRQIKLILGTVANDCPFDKENPRRLVKIGVALMIGSVVVKLAEAWVAYVIVDMLKLSNIDINFGGVNGTMLLSGILVIILAGVFQYGNYLQEEYDTTL